MLTRLKSFLEERTGWPSALARVLDTPIAGGARVAYSFGLLLLSLVAVEVATGLALMTVYAPSTNTAWASVFYIEHAYRWGRVVRGVHYWAAQAMVVVALTNMLQVVVFGAYRRPREFTWWVGLALFGLVLGLAHTGTLLPWDQSAYWITQVEAAITSTVPPVGRDAQRFLQGGAQISTLTITRAYAMHVGLLPLLLVAVFAVQYFLHRRHGFLRPSRIGDDALPSAGATEDDIAAARAKGIRVGRLWPDQIALAGILGLAVLAVVFYLARGRGAPLDAPADPLDSGFPARPEWYLLWLFELRKHFHGKFEPVATVVIPGLATMFLVALPMLDRGAPRSIARRAPALAGFLVLGAGVVALTLITIRRDNRDLRGVVQPRQRAEQRAHRARVLAAAGIPPEGPLEMVRNDPQVRPGELYAQYCGTCHADPDVPLRDAHGQRTNARGPALWGFGTREWMRALLVNPDADALFGRTVIHDMTPQAQRLGDDGMRAVIEYMYSVAVEPGDAPADAALAARGSEVYHNRCTICHQGPGDLSETDAADRDAPDLSHWGSRAYIRAQILSPETHENYGDRNHMPNFREELRGRDLEWVVDYVRSLRTRAAPTPQQPPPRPAADPAAAPPADE